MGSTNYKKDEVDLKGRLIYTSHKYRWSFLRLVVRNENNIALESLSNRRRKRSTSDGVSRK